MALDFKVSTANDCNSFNFTSTTSYCTVGYDVEYVVPQVYGNVLDAGVGEVIVLASPILSPGLDVTTSATAIKWTWENSSGATVDEHGAQALISNLNTNATTVITLSVTANGGSVLTTAKTMQFLVTLDSSGILLDYFIPNIDVSVSNAPSAHFTSDFIRASSGTTYTFTTYRYKRYTADSYIALASNAIDVTHDYSTSSTPGLPTGDQNFIYNVTYDGANTLTANAGLSIKASTNDCDGELVEGEVTAVSLAIEDPDGNLDSITLTLADFTSGAIISIDSDDLTNTSIKDGIYKFTLIGQSTNNGNNFTFTKVYEIPFTCAIKCKIYDLLYEAINDDCNCDDFTATKKWAAILAESMRRSALRAVGCNKKNHFNTLIDKIDDFLANTDCKNC